MGLRCWHGSYHGSYLGSQLRKLFRTIQSFTHSNNLRSRLVCTLRTTSRMIHSLEQRRPHIPSSVASHFLKSHSSRHSLQSSPQWFKKRRGVANGIAVSGSGLGGLIYSLASEAMIRNLGLAWYIPPLRKYLFAFSQENVNLSELDRLAIGHSEIHEFCFPELKEH